MSELSLLCVFAHPDDESLGMGGTLVKYAEENVATHLVCGTRGEHGWNGSFEEYPGEAVLGATREAELRTAAQKLGLRSVSFLDYVDGELEHANPTEATRKIVEHIRRLQPQVVVTFGPDGVYGHPDHIAISQLTTAAVVCAAHTSYTTGGQPPHSVSKLYYRVWTQAGLNAYEDFFGSLVIRVAGEDLNSFAWEDWMVTTCVEAGEHWRRAWEAARSHRSQLPNLEAQSRLPDEYKQRLLGTDTYYRAFSRVNGGRALESDLFEGVR